MKIHDYLPEISTEETALVQGNVAKSLHKSVREKMKKEKITWDQLVTAACQAYLSEKPNKK